MVANGIHVHTNGSTTDGKSATSNGTTIQDLDALIVGAGFGGVYQLKRLRDLGYKVLLVEAGSNYGGTWFWNRYPGSRVDTAGPLYQYSHPELRENWSWSQRFPSSEEIRGYFDHVAETWDLRRDTKFDSFVDSARWDEGAMKWMVGTKDGATYRVSWLLLNIGFAARKYVPDWKGIERFKGVLIHPCAWPHTDPDIRDKKVAVIGTGATAVQIIQSLHKIVSQLVVFQRTPNTALPMKQVTYNETTPGPTDSEISVALSDRTSSFAGFDYNFLPRNTFSDSPSERLQTYESLWAEGSFKFQLATYQDLMFSSEANRAAYEFWRAKTIARIRDERVAELLAPAKQPYAFGCKRIPLEQGYFEAFNEPHVTLIDVNQTPIVEITEEGINTAKEDFQFDYIICATGYDNFTGGLTQIDIQGVHGTSLKDYWKEGVKTNLGMSVHGFPNLWFTYGPQAPTPLCNGPTCAEVQGEWIVGMMEYLKERGLRRIEASEESEKRWKESILKIAYSSLLPGTKSWYMGDNIPGKPREPLIYLGGVPSFNGILKETAGSGYTGFDLS